MRRFLAGIAVLLCVIFTAAGCTHPRAPVPKKSPQVVTVGPYTLPEPLTPPGAIETLSIQKQPGELPLVLLQMGVRLFYFDSYLHITMGRYTPYRIIAILKCVLPVIGNKPIIYYDDTNWRSVPNTRVIFVPRNDDSNPFLWIVIQTDFPTRA